MIRHLTLTAAVVALAAPALAQPSSLPAVTLRIGSRGAPVQALQSALNQAAGAGLAVDGAFGPATDRAVRAFQRSQGLAVDGVVGPQTRAALERALAGGTSSSARGRLSSLFGGSGSGAATPGATAPAATAPGATPGASVPRSAGGSGGRAFLAGAGSGSQREAATQRELLAGNLPSFLRRFVDVTIRGQDTRGQAHTVTLRVMPDYLSVGSDADFVRMPMTPQTAQRVADRYGCVLPTTKMVDAIWAAATVKLSPSPLPPGPAMTTNGYFLRHNERVEAQRGSAPLGALVAGHKKDVVISTRLFSRPGRVAIYGWHRTNGSPIQPLTTVHGASYVDYSHGVRLVQQTVILDGQPRPIGDVLGDSVLWPLLSNEGRLAPARIP